MYGYRSIAFSHSTSFLGRNGMFGAKAMTAVVHAHGLDGNKVVSFAPITTKGIEGRCWIEFPVGDIPQVIAALQSLAEENKKEEEENAKRNNA